MIQIFVADGTDGRDQPKVVQEVLADLKTNINVIAFLLYLCVALLLSLRIALLLYLSVDLLLHD